MNTLLIIPWLETSAIKIFWKTTSWFELLSEQIIRDPKNENNELFNFLYKINLDEISNIIICSWPWRFTSLRLFCNTVNVIANEKNIDLYNVPTYEYFSKKTMDKVQILFQLNQSEVFVYDKLETKIVKFEELKWDGKYYWFIRNKNLLDDGLSEIWEDVLDDKNVIGSFLVEKYKTDMVIPFYWK